MKTMVKNAILGVILVCSFCVFADSGQPVPSEERSSSRFQLISSAIEHSRPFGGSSSGCCDVEVRLKVTYTLNGQTYSKWSTTKTISPGGQDVFVVQISNNAVVIDEFFDFKINGVDIGGWSYYSDSSGGNGQDGVGLCSACPVTSEVILWSAPNGTAGLKHFYFDWLI